MAAGKDGTRVTARAKGKVERPFRTVKEAHETLYHFHKPDTEAQANEWLFRYLLRYNEQQHRSQPHSRLADWLAHLPAEGLREMCTWEQFCRFAREPERRKVGVDARVTVAGTAYEVDPQLGGEDCSCYGACLTTPCTSNTRASVLAPMPRWPADSLHRYRAFKRGKREERADRIRHTPISSRLPLAALAGDDLQMQPTVHRPACRHAPRSPSMRTPWSTTFPRRWRRSSPLPRSWACRCKLTPDDRAFIDQVLEETRMRRLVLGRSVTTCVPNHQEQTMRVDVMQHYGFAAAEPRRVL